MRVLKQVSLKNALNTHYIDDVREWRNQDFVRMQMLNSQIISVEQHNEYVCGLRNDSTRIIIILFLDNVPSGVFRCIYDSKTNTASTGFYLVKEESFIGLGILVAYMNYSCLFYRWPDCEMKGFVNVNNTSSKRILESLGVEITPYDSMFDRIWLNREMFDKKSNEICRGLRRLFEWNDSVFSQI